jgi:hypothetical protein
MAVQPVRKFSLNVGHRCMLKGNGQDSNHGVANIDKWLGDRKWDVIHFNWGLWDICYRSPASKEQGHRDKVNGTLSVAPGDIPEKPRIARRPPEEDGCGIDLVRHDPRA